MIINSRKKFIRTLSDINRARVDKIIYETSGKMLVWSSNALRMVFDALSDANVLRIRELRIVGKKYVKLRGYNTVCVVGIIDGGNQNEQPIFVVKSHNRFWSEIAGFFRRFVVFVKKYFTTAGQNMDLQQAYQAMQWDPHAGDVRVVKGVSELIDEVSARLHFDPMDRNFSSRVMGAPARLFIESFEDFKERFDHYYSIYTNPHSSAQQKADAKDELIALSLQAQLVRVLYNHLRRGGNRSGGRHMFVHYQNLYNALEREGIFHKIDSNNFLQGVNIPNVSPN